MEGNSLAKIVNRKFNFLCSFHYRYVYVLIPLLVYFLIQNLKLQLGTAIAQHSCNCSLFNWINSNTNKCLAKRAPYGQIMWYLNFSTQICRKRLLSRFLGIQNQLFSWQDISDGSKIKCTSKCGNWIDCPQMNHVKHREIFEQRQCLDCIKTRNTLINEHFITQSHGPCIRIYSFVHISSPPTKEGKLWQSHSHQTI
jgi:hypothetical protein